ncbi:MAG: polyprenol monophosphomannose synthase [Myxococcales bacterium]|nr:MAG: polyprenol monophosphomannose synthase [Myxococcales bacterium]
MSLLIVTPTYNEADNLPTFIEGVQAVVPEADILVVDDNSPDGTGELAERMATKDSRIKVIHRSGKLGIGSAYIEAFHWALRNDYDAVAQMDTDLSHDPKHLPAFLEALAEGADVVLGSRNIPGGKVEGWGPTRHFVSKGGSLYSRMILGLGVRDLTGGYKVWKKEALQALDLDAVQSEGYSFQIEMTYRAIRKGFKVKEVPITFIDRRVGQSKMSKAIFKEAVFMVWKLRFMAASNRL